MRNVYIKNNGKDVYESYLKDIALKVNVAEKISIAEALGRVTAEAVFAVLSDPSYNAAAMDGIAVTAKNTAAARERAPLRLKEGVDFIYINTGGAVVSPYDAVIMIEDVVVKDGFAEITAPAYPYQHVRVKGESVTAGEMILPSGFTIRPEDVGALAASGNMFIKVIKKPIIGVIPTGNEMTRVPEEVKSGKLMESNSLMFAALIKENNAYPLVYPIVSDDKEELKEALLKAVGECDAVIVNAGSSAGTKDFTADTIALCGKVYAHGFAIKPGKPAIIGTINGKPVLGLPGYPVSAYISYGIFAERIVNFLGGRTAYSRTKVKAKLTKTVDGSFKNTEIVRVSMGLVNDTLVATPLPRGAARIMSLVKADGLLKVDRLSEGIEAGETVEVELKKPLEDISRQLVIIGSHDLIVDVIGDKLPVTSAHTGSLGGISALMRGECHIAPVHLLDEESGIYNIPQIKKYFRGKRIALIKGVGRTQGFIVPKGNPKNITNFASLKGNKYANRQRGAGTRILFDYMLKKEGVSKDSFSGYEKEYTTHLAVAAAVENGTADTGLGVLSAAMATNMDFVPIASEEYDFITEEKNLSDERVQNFIAFLKSEEFRSAAEKIGGYDLKCPGDTVIIDA